MGHNPVIQVPLEEPCVNWMLLRAPDTEFQRGFGHQQTGKLVRQFQETELHTV